VIPLAAYQPAPFDAFQVGESRQCTDRRPGSYSTTGW
jgi:hypothetical protein